MEFINYKNFSEWTEKNNLGCFDPKFGKNLEKFLSFKKSFPIPVDSGQKTHISQYLLPDLEFDEGVFYLSGFDVWESSNQELINSYLSSLGDKRRFNDSPCFKFNYSDINQIKCLFSVVLYLYYDAVIVLKYEDKYLVVNISHDEILDIYSNDEIEMKKIADYMDSKSQI